MTIAEKASWYIDQELIKIAMGDTPEFLEPKNHLFTIHSIYGGNECIVCGNNEEVHKNGIPSS